MLRGRFLLKCLPAFVLLSATVYAATRMSVGEPAPLVLPVRAVAIRTVDVRFSPARPLERHMRAATPAYRPLDATLLHDLTAAADGSIWIAPLFNGHQWGGEYERAVRYDPHAMTTDIYKIARQKPQPIVVLPEANGGVWVLDHAGFVGRYSPDGALTLTTAPDLGALPKALAIARNGDVWMTEPARASLGRIDQKTGAWNEILFPPSLGALGDLSIDSNDDVWFAQPQGSRIDRYTPVALRLATFFLPPTIGDLKVVRSDGRHVWFIDEGSHLGRLDPTTGRIHVWPIPEGTATTVTPVAGGALVTTGGALLQLDPASQRFSKLAWPKGFAPDNVTTDRRGGAWVAGTTGIAHLDKSATSAVMFPIRDIDAPTPLVAGADGRVCFLVGGQAACLASNSIVTLYRSESAPGTIGVAAGLHGLWLAERGRLTNVDTLTAIRHFAYLADWFGPADLAVAPNGTLWATGHGTVERFSTSGRAMAIQVGEAGHGPFGIAVDGDSRLWFAMDRAVGVVRVEAGTTTVKRYPTGGNSAPEGIAVDANGTAWCTDTTGAILEIASTGAVRRHMLPTKDAVPFGITIGPDKAIWFTEFYRDSIGRLDPSSGAVTEYPLGPTHRFPTSIIAADGSIWFLDLSGSLGRLSARGEVTAVSVPTPGP